MEEYAINRNNVSIMACFPHPMGFSLHHAVVLFRKLLRSGCSIFLENFFSRSFIVSIYYT
ncbi:hypothetical protein PBCV1_a398aR [Paramecium bursaria Chlorella virus 1]|uniref:Uncharacterized protein n=1 Tax=Paramecium bursaria Chlorella virus 1 TaxID=10506 RepID=F8TU33_PBCV1|nr:hypothetical protein PBCV1_a398aR [Paramecium bursaria Chlorella virus 1]AEI70094.1 hypothetical protein [Paramecium bursaria Chlorella virus 1]